MVEDKKETIDFRHPEPSQVGVLARSSVKWTVVFLLARQVATLGTTMVLSRYVSPHETGLFAMVSTLVAFVTLFDTGLIWATVQPKNLTKTQVDSLVIFGFSLGFFVYVLCVLFSPFLAAFYSEPMLVSIISVLAVAPAVNSWCTQYSALLRRKLQQKINNGIETVAIFASCIVALVLIYFKLGVWALIWQSVSIYIVRFILLFIFSNYKIDWPLKFSCESFDIIKMGMRFALSNYICFFQLYLGGILVGKLFGSEQLGFYTKAVGLKLLPMMYIIVIANDVMVSSIASFAGEKKRLCEFYQIGTSLICLFGCGAIGFMWLAADELTNILYGSQWNNTIPMLKWMVVGGVMLPLTSSATWLFLGLGRSHEQMRLNMCLTLLVLVLYFFIATYATTINQFIIAESVFFIFSALLNLYIANRIAYIPFYETLKTGGVCALAAIFTSVFLEQMWLFFSVTNNNVFFSVLYKMSIFGLCYAILCFLFVYNIPIRFIMIIRKKIISRFLWLNKVWKVEC